MHPLIASTLATLPLQAGMARDLYRTKPVAKPANTDARNALGKHMYSVLKITLMMLRYLLKLTRMSLSLLINLLNLMKKILRRLLM